MSSISSINNSTSYMDYGRFASGKKIQSAADGAAELSIIQKEDAQIRGQKAGENNIGAAKDMLNVAEGAMAGIADYLQRIRELGVQASNTATMTDADRASIQAEVEQLKQGISDIASQTTFNTKEVLDGTYDKFQIATDANGNGMEVTIANATLQMLGIEDFDVTKDFSMQDIDDALAKVNAGRSGMGAQTNALTFAYDNSANGRLNHAAGKSRLEDLDFAEAISEKKKKETLQEYALFMRKKRQNDEAKRMGSLFA
ncbi:MAG: flagellin [Clostridiales bacterium]|nr:flagellin FliC5 [Roseburia sp.]MDD7637561.1 flagellin [Clostridiales bacterium]MDY4112487.1 flagellin [Roseburia sp.]